jgi:hypothetical protein
MSIWFELQLLIFFASLNSVAENITFAAPTVTCTNCQVNEVTNYVVTINRNLDPSYGIITNLLIPANSDITITCPLQYSFNGSESCQSITITSTPPYTPPSSYNCSSSANTITIEGAITTDLRVSAVVIIISNVANPPFAGTTSRFSATIGSDISGGSPTNSIGTVIIDPGSFTDSKITFDPNTVNETSSMLISAYLGNPVPAGSFFIISFSSNKWKNELNPNHNLSIIGTLNCLAPPTSVTLL